MLRSHTSSVFVLKYYAPIILFCCTFVFWSVGFRWAQLIFLIPLFAGVLFHGSLAILQVPDGKIRYRRLFGWRRLPYNEIVDCGVAWGIGIGYLRLKHFLFPWGRLYFVLDQNEKLFGRGEYPLLRYIQEHSRR
jgi:hypothetical protein